MTHVLLIKVFDLLIFLHGNNQSRQGGRVTLIWVAAISGAILVLRMVL